jgi:hypothetical protein
VWANGGFVTKHAFGVYSTTPPVAGFRHADPQAEIDALPKRAVDGDATGDATVEAYTVMHTRDGEPETALAACLLAGVVVGVETRPDAQFEPSELELLTAHKEYGCVSLWCVTSGRAYPFVFMPRVVKGVIPCTQLIYCRDIEDFVRFARPIGRYLAKHGRPVVIIDSNGSIPGLVGKYFDGKLPKYQRSGAAEFWDLAYTEAVMFGL